MRTPDVRGLSDIDPRLLMEAFRRARERADNVNIDSSTLFSAIIDAARRGARDIYSLVKATAAARPEATKPRAKPWDHAA